MVDIGECLRWYKRPDVQKAMLAGAANREVGIRYGEKGFGKRPDVLVYPKDILEFAKKGATSFHVSEEHWENPQVLAPGLSQSQLDTLRTGWDLVLDIDCPLWKYSKLITAEAIHLIQQFGISSVTVKFSGNKGFHIGVPFGAFPKRFKGVPLASLFPEAPRNISLYIAARLEKSLLASFTPRDRREIAGFLGKKQEEVFVHYCGVCGRSIPNTPRVQFICPTCGRVVSPDRELPYLVCDKCKKIMDKRVMPQACPHCGSKAPPKQRFDISTILKIDTLLISSRHLYRMAYSLHEKSGLVSVPIAPDAVLDFSKGQAEPSRVRITPGLMFLGERAVHGEAAPLLIEAYDFAAEAGSQDTAPQWQNREFELPKTPVTARYFPPCIKTILKGLTDGRKRALFILLNFLGSMGWDFERIESFILDWNKRNREPLRENLVKSHLIFFKRKRQLRLPPNCHKPGYYKDIGVCNPDEICKRIKNPANYYRLKKGRKK